MLIPQLLDKAEPNFNFENSGQILRFRVLYDYLDDFIMPRFIVAVHQDIDNGIQWRKGVLLHNQRLNSSALVKVNYQDKLLSIEVNGEQKRDYFAAIRHDLQKIHDSFEWQKKPVELVPLPDNPDYTVEYEELIGYELDGDDNYRVGKLRKVYSVSELLNGIEKPETRKKEMGDTHYHHHDHKGDYVENKEMTARKIKTDIYVEGDNNGDIAKRDINKGQTNDEVKQLLSELLKQIKELNSKVPAENKQAVADMSRDVEDLANEINSDNPRQRNSLFSLEGIKEAATQLGETATPIMEIAEKISPFLQMLS